MPKLAFNADLTEGYGLMGAMTGMEKTVKSNNYRAAIIEYAHNEMSARMDQDVDLLAMATPRSLQHVYEWGMTGVPQGRLWRHKLSGQGGHREATFEWIASKLPIPSPQERASNPDDPMSMVPPEVVNRLSDRKHFFYWKAPLMEYRIRVSISPKHAKKLFIPTGGEVLQAGYRGRRNRTYVFVDGPVYVMAGNENTFGSFTGAWTAWWATRASQVFSETVEKAAERDLGQAVVRGARAGRASRARTRSVGLTAVASQKAAMKVGEDLAQAYLETRAARYRAAKRWLE